MDFTCPKCQAQVTRIPEPPIRAGTEWNCPSCKATVTIPLYCTQCDPPSKAKKRFLDTPAGFVPGQPQRCPAGHLFVAKISLNQTHDKLKLLGTEVGQYHQDMRVAALEVALKRSVGGGFCQGAVLDWIRRALLGGKYAHINLENRLGEKSNPSVMHQMRQDKRVANAQVNIVSSQLNAIPNLVATAQNIQQAGLDDAREKYDIAYQRIQQSSAAIEKKNAAIKNITQQLKAAEAEAKSTFKKRMDQIGDLDGRPALKQYWNSYAKVMDEFLAADRSARQKTGASAHGFGSLKPVKSLNAKEWMGGVAEFARLILLDSEFGPNRAAYVGVSATSGAGHAIAVHRLNTGDKFHLFDPNFGVYELTRPKVRDAMVYLFTVHYPNSLAGGNDDHPYEVNGKVWGEYSIFESAVPAAQSVTVNQLS